MENLQVHVRRGYAALVGSMSAVFGLLAYDVLVAFFPSLGLGPTTMSAGGFPAAFSHRLGVAQILVVVALLAFSGFVGGVAVGQFFPWRFNGKSRPMIARILETSALGASAVGLGIAWLAILALALARLVGGLSVIDILMAFAGYFAIGLLGGLVVAVTRIIRLPQDDTQKGVEAGPSRIEQAVYTGLTSKPVTLASVFSWVVIPGVLTLTVGMDAAFAEIVIGIGGGLFFGFWAAVALAAATGSLGSSKSALKGIAILAGFPLGAVSAVTGSGLCYSVGGGHLGETASLVGMFLGFFSVSVGAFAGIFGAPFAHLLIRATRREWKSEDTDDGAVPDVETRGFCVRRFAVVFLVLLAASVAARFYVESGERLVAAVTRGDTRTARWALSVGAAPNTPSMSGLTPLSAAIENENPELVEILLQAGADPNLSGSASTTPLHLAAQHESAEIVAALLNAGAEVDPTVFMSGSPLNLGAGDFEVLKLLLEAGADPNGHSARSPLQTALREGNIDGARLLLTYGADPDGGAKKDASKPIYMAAAAGREELFFDLFERGSVLDWASKDAQNLLIGAIERGHEQIVEALLDNGVDVNQRLGLHTALYNSNDSMAVLLIERGADIGATDERGRTPLHLAAWRKCLLSAEMLLDWGADINAQTLSHDTPLHFSVGQTGTRETRLMIEILLERGADSQIVNDASETAYDKATTYQKELIRKSEENLRENQRNVAREE